jgi:hypothetical protein
MVVRNPPIRPRKGMGRLGQSQGSDAYFCEEVGGHGDESLARALAVPAGQKMPDRITLFAAAIEAASDQSLERSRPLGADPTLSLQWGLNVIQDEGASSRVA